MRISRRGYIDTSYGQMHYREVKPESEVRGNVVLLHQVSSSSAMYDEVMGYLAEQGFRCVAPDSPGFGSSDSLPGAAEISAYSDFFEAFIDAFAFESYTLLGHHNGARQALLLAAREPAGLEMVIAVNAPYHPNKSLRGQRFDEKQIRDPTPTDDARHILHEWNRLRDLALESLPAGVRGLTPEHHTRELVDTLRAKNYAAMYRISFSHDIENAILKVTVPIVFISCDGDWLGANQAAAAALAREGSVIRLSGGVFVFDQRPQAISDVLVALLRGQSVEFAQKQADRWPWGKVPNELIEEHPTV